MRPPLDALRRMLRRLPARGRRTALLAVTLVAVGTALAQAEANIVLLGTGGDDIIQGTNASEAIYGGPGNDTLLGGGGNDELDGGPGADTISGGPGIDAVSYSGSAPVKVTLDGIANDGAAGEGDNVLPDVEDIYGGEGDDKLTGDAGANTIDGGAGDDVIDGGGGRDALYGGPGNDTILARDGVQDIVDCGPGDDVAIVDAIDIVTNCEHVELPPVTPPPRLSKLLPVETRIGSIVLAGIVPGSHVTVACRSGCRPAASRGRPLVRVRDARPDQGGLQLRLPANPALAGGSTFELGVRAPGASARCTVYVLSNPLRRVSPAHAACTTVARSG